MQQKIIDLIAEIQAFDTNDDLVLEQFRIRFLGKKGIVTGLFDDFRLLSAEEKKNAGQALNNLKTLALDRIESIKSRIEESIALTPQHTPDLTRPSTLFEPGSRHPLSLVRKRMVEVFLRLGYTIEEGPEIEDDWHNFSALNFPPDHPARDMQDTFFIDSDPDIALRTHTSSVQVRVMEQRQPPIRSIFPGRVYRNEAISARAHCFFHQIEGLYVDKGVTFIELKQTLLHFAQEMFGSQTEIRLRPSYFPFTEPSAEMDISCNLCGGKGCAFCKHTGWVEILGCGMVDPNVLTNCGINPNEYSGFAFGIGIERTTNLIYQIKDLRMFSENDIRFLKQFTPAI